MRQNSENSLGEQKFATANEDQPKVGSTSHGSFGVVEEAEDTGVVEFVRVVLDEEVACTRFIYVGRE